MSSVARIMASSPVKGIPRWERCVRCGIDTSIDSRRRACTDCHEVDGPYVRKALGR